MRLYQIRAFFPPVLSILFLCGFGFIDKIAAQQSGEGFGFDQLAVPKITPHGFENRIEHGASEGDKNAKKSSSMGFYLSREELEEKSKQKNEFGALLLKSGQLLRDNAELLGREYVVEGPHGRYKLPKHQVEFAGEDAEGVYTYKRSQPASENYRGAFALAKWCLANGLYEQSIAEFQRCKSLVGYPQAVQALDTEIAAVRLVQANNEKKEGAESEEKTTASPEKTSEDGDPRLLDPFDYKQWSRNVPPAVVESFKKNVQPQLIRRCAATDCHNAGSEQEFRLYHLQREFSGAETTARNLKAVLEQVDFDQPGMSPLITFPLSEHGGSKRLFTNQTQKQLNAIYQWIQTVPPAMPEYVEKSRREKQEAAALLQALQQEHQIPERKNEIRDDFIPVEKSSPIPRMGRNATLMKESAIRQSHFTFSPRGNPQEQKIEFASHSPGFQGDSMKTPPPKRAEGENPSPNRAGDLRQRLQKIPRTSPDSYDPAPFNRKYHGG